MNFIDLIERNNFLKQIFKNDIRTDKIKINRIELVSPSRLNFDIQIFEKPDFIPEKWGQWNVGFNTIVIELTIHSLFEVIIENWQKNTSLVKLTYDKIGDKIELRVSDPTWNLSIIAQLIVYQKCSVFIDTNFNNI
ncbi:MAG: hypothetical protein IPO39_00415 [Bacteroidetes bacterium]|nr:hypothetical protein [Bacteroidota bacterium]